jgi:hypothetical protein
MLRTIWIAGVLAACATGGQSTNEPRSDAHGQTDGHSEIPIDGSVTFLDAPHSTPDAFVPKDAPPPPPPDAASSLFCTTNNQCTNAGECCITLGQPQGFCGPGTIFLGECIPQ